MHGTSGTGACHSPEPGPPGEEGSFISGSEEGHSVDSSNKEDDQIQNKLSIDCMHVVESIKRPLFTHVLSIPIQYSPGGVDPVTSYMHAYNKVPAGLHTLDRYCICTDMNLSTPDLMIVVNCKNCDFVGFPCANCANYIFNGELGPGNF